jgi:DNA invertase Pin-like site-specific DNA recombinase
MHYGYVRVSKDEQDNGAVAQESAIRDACPKSVKFYEDRLSGATEIQKRPALLAMIGVLAKGDTVWVQKRDRIARDVVIAGMIVRLIQKRGATLQSADGIGNGDDPAAALIATVVDAVAQYERALISMRTAAALAVKRERGEKTGGSTPYGYYVDLQGKGPTKVLRPMTEQQERIADMQEMRDSGMSYAQIASFMNNRKFPAPNSLQWYGNTVRRILLAASGHEQE